MNTLSDGAEALLTSSDSASAVRGDVTVSNEGSFAVGAISSLGEGKITVFSTALLTTGDVMAASGYANRTFVIALFDEVVGADTTPYGCNVVTTGSLALQNLTAREARLYTAIILTVPVLLTVLGAVLIIKRKNA